jgi:hypothetical protein
MALERCEHGEASVHHFHADPVAWEDDDFEIALAVMSAFPSVDMERRAMPLVAPQVWENRLPPPCVAKRFSFQFAFAPESLTTLAHRAISLLTCASNSAGVEPTI